MSFLLSKKAGRRMLLPRLGFISMLLMYQYSRVEVVVSVVAVMVDHSLYVEGIIVLSSSSAGEWLAAVGGAHQSHGSGGKDT